MKRLLILNIILSLVLFGCAHRLDPKGSLPIPIRTTAPKPAFYNGVYKLANPGVVHIVLLFPGGKILDPPGKEGAARLLGATMVSGGTHDLGPLKTEEILDDLAANVSIRSEREFTWASIDVLPEDAKQGTSLFLSLLKSPGLDPKRLAIERDKFKDKIKRDEEDATRVAFDELRRHLYKGDPRSHMPTMASLNAITRKDLIALHKQIFTNKPVIGIIGDLDDESLESIKKEEALPYNLLGIPKNPEFGSFTRVAKDKQCVLVMTHLGPSMNESSYPAAYIADYIIGSSGLSSRITQEVRTKRGLAYSAGSFYQARPAWGIFGIYVITETKNLKEVKHAIKNALDTVSKGITTEEIKWAKQAIINQQAVMYNSPKKVLSHAMESAFYRIPPEFDDIFLDKIYNTTTEEVNNAASKLVKGPWVEVVVNP